MPKNPVENATDRCMFAHQAEQATRPARIPLQVLARSYVECHSPKWRLTGESFNLQTGIIETRFMLSAGQNSVQYCKVETYVPHTIRLNPKKDPTGKPRCGASSCVCPTIVQTVPIPKKGELTSDIPSGPITCEKRPNVRPAPLACMLAILHSMPQNSHRSGSCNSS